MRLAVWCFVFIWSLDFGVWCFAAAPQNILLIIADDYGADSSSLYNSTNNGASLPPTPNIVSLAQSGILFRNAYANPVCSPTRACLLTGRYAYRTGVGDVVLTGNGTLQASEFTLPEAFAANPTLGYHLAQFGKWHLANGVNTPSTLGGWTNFAGSLMGAISSYTNWTKTVNGSSSTTTNYATTDIVNDATAWIQARGTNPWLAWVAFNAPHTPFHLPPTNLCPHYATLSGTTQDINANPRKYFEAMTEAMDTEIGRLLAAVNRANTHIIFLGDNGTQGNVLQPPYPSTHDKDTLYEGGTHVPFIIAGPSVVNPNRTNDSLVHVVDVYSTILEMAGANIATRVPTNVTIDGQSLLPILQGGSNSRRYVFTEVFGLDRPPGSSGKALRNSQFKLIQFDNRQEFYDLAVDPYEKTNLLSSALTATAQSNYFSLTLRLGGYQQTIAQPVINGKSRSGNQFTLTVPSAVNLNYSLWRAAELSDLSWAPVINAIVATNNSVVSLTDTNASGGAEFYQVVGTVP